MMVTIFLNKQFKYNNNNYYYYYCLILDAVYAAIDEPENNSVTYDQIDLNAAQREISDAFEEVVAQHSRTGII